LRNLTDRRVLASLDPGRRHLGRRNVLTRIRASSRPSLFFAVLPEKYSGERISPPQKSSLFATSDGKITATWSLLFHCFSLFLDLAYLIHN